MHTTPTKAGRIRSVQGGPCLSPSEQKTDAKSAARLHLVQGIPEGRVEFVRAVPIQFDESNTRGEPPLVRNADEHPPIALAGQHDRDLSSDAVDKAVADDAVVLHDIAGPHRPLDAAPETHRRPH